MKIFKYITLALCFTLMTFVVSGCDKDNDEHNETVDLSTYILGTWHSYRATVYGNGQEKTVDITKENEWSIAYIEMNFRPDGIFEIKGWSNEHLNSNGTSKWITEVGQYTVIENTVELRELTENTEDNNTTIGFRVNTGNATKRATIEDDVITLMFDPTEKKLWFRSSQYVNGINVVVNIYMKK